MTRGHSGFSRRTNANTHELVLVTSRTVTTITVAALYLEPATGHAPTLPPPSRPRSARHARAHDALSAHGPRHDSNRTQAITPRGSPTACGHTHTLHTPARTRLCCTHTRTHVAAHSRTAHSQTASHTHAAHTCSNSNTHTHTTNSSTHAHKHARNARMYSCNAYTYTCEHATLTHTHALTNTQTHTHA